MRLHRGPTWFFRQSRYSLCTAHETRTHTHNTHTHHVKFSTNRLMLDRLTHFGCLQQQQRHEKQKQNTKQKDEWWMLQMKPPTVAPIYSYCISYSTRTVWLLSTWFHVVTILIFYFCLTDQSIEYKAVNDIVKELKDPNAIIQRINVNDSKQNESILVSNWFDSLGCIGF